MGMQIRLDSLQIKINDRGYFLPADLKEAMASSVEEISAPIKKRNPVATNAGPFSV
jgi:hypothetical protein